MAIYQARVILQVDVFLALAVGKPRIVAEQKYRYFVKFLRDIKLRVISQKIVLRQHRHLRCRVLTSQPIKSPLIKKARWITAGLLYELVIARDVD